MGTGFPNAWENADWRFLVDLRNGYVAFAGGVLFLFCRLSDGAISSDDGSSSSWLSVSDYDGCGMVLSGFEVPAGNSVCKLIPLVCSFRVGRPPVRFPVVLAFRFARLSIFLCANIFSF